MRLPFVASVTELRFTMCSFDTLKTMLDVVWAFPNLSSLAVRSCTIQESPNHSKNPRLCVVCEKVRACRKLTRLELDIAVSMSLPHPLDDFTNATCPRPYSHIHPLSIQSQQAYSAVPSQS